MMRLFVNGAAASAGGGLTYLRNVLPHLSLYADVETTVALNPEYSLELPIPANIAVVETDREYGAARRFLWEQFGLKARLRAAHANVLLSTGNFGMRKCPIPQVLLSGNALYISQDFSADLRGRGEYATLVAHNVRTLLAKRSIFWADRTIAPSLAFANDLRRWTGAASIEAIHHGFDHEAFFRDQEALFGAQNRIAAYPNALRLLFVSPYNYYRNFETLFHAIPLIRKQTGREVKLFLTCKLQPNTNPGSYDTDRAAKLVSKLGIQEDVVELGPVPNRLLHHVYRACDLYLTASYAETFAHPLVEAMACGLPIVASSLAVHKEICGEAAVYFEPFSAQELAQQVSQVTQNLLRLKQMSQAAEKRSHDFSWKKHVEQLLDVLRSVVASPR